MASGGMMPWQWVICGSFFQHGNNSWKRDTIAFHGACHEYSHKSYASLTCMLSFPDMYFENDTTFSWQSIYISLGLWKENAVLSKNGVLFENVFFVNHVINRRRALIAKSPTFFVVVSTLSMCIWGVSRKLATFGKMTVTGVSQIFECVIIVFVSRR